MSDSMKTSSPMNEENPNNNNSNININSNIHSSLNNTSMISNNSILLDDNLQSNNSHNSNNNKKKEIYNYEAPWTIYSMAWRRRPEGKFQLAIGSFIEEYVNQIQIVQISKDETTGETSWSCDHPYPPTKILWAPPKYNLGSGKESDIFATSGDYLRIWNVNGDHSIQMKGVLNNNKHAEYCAPLTGFDWNETEPSMIGSCSIDTTCTIWDVVAMTPKTQLIAHDKEVYDIAFACGKDIFGSVGADGSLRMFDLRSLEHSTILYETPDLSPLLRLAWNKQDPNYIAVIQAEGNKTIIIDVRMPTYPVTELLGHEGVVNGIAWAPHSAHHICTVGDDHQALIWEINSRSPVIEDPILAFTADGEINQLQWCSSHEDWIAIDVGKAMQILRV
eukprot:gene14376-15905_t